MYEPLESQRDNGATNRGFAFVEFESHMDSGVQIRQKFLILMTENRTET